MSTKLDTLRSTYPTFTYLDFAVTLEENNLLCTYRYQIDNLTTFTHRVTFSPIDPAAYTAHPDFINHLAFHLGLVEMFSYWKLTCSPIIKLAAGDLPAAALPFWQKLLLRGMSEYFYVNHLDFTAPDFVTWQTHSASTHHAPPTPTKPGAVHSEKLLVGFAGGKDSLLTARLLAQAGYTFTPFILEPASPAALTTAQPFSAAFGTSVFRATRHLDPQLLSLNLARHPDNSPIYFNGHIPFSAVLAFAGVLAESLGNYQSFVVSNEASACENSTTWHDQPINHQYSKSLEFEQDFRTYVSQFLFTNQPHPNNAYFSLLRPWYELKIAQEFARLATPADLHTFRSCNVGQKQNIWCEHCSKCLFVFLMLYPFLEENVLVGTVFSQNLFDQDELAPELYQLAGLTNSKPLECVGTIEEVQCACYLAIKKYTAAGRACPTMLQTIKTKIIDTQTGWDQRVQNLLDFRGNNFLPAALAPLIT